MSLILDLRSTSLTGPKRKLFASKRINKKKKDRGGAEIQELLIKFLSLSSNLTSQGQKI